MTEDSRKILVIGGSRGIGAAIVQRFAENGDSVAFTYAGSAEAAATLQKNTAAVAVLSDASDREALIAVIRAQGKLDVLVVNAGALVLGNPLDLDADAVDRMIDLNVRAPIMPPSRLPGAWPRVAGLSSSARSMATGCP
jgi:cyclic-di-GMP-binding biofilm dispersal mediator protein